MRLDYLLSKEKSKGDCCSIMSVLYKNMELPVAMRIGDPPVPIPNTMVKPYTAYGTMLETAWESGWLPDSKKWAYSSAG